MYDIFVIGGGINGVGIAADAAGRGLKVGLCEKGDLAEATSQYSSKLIHGGLRYLENFEFRLVRESLSERETLLRMARHLVHPMRFFMPHRYNTRPRWLIRIGLFLYDFLGRKNSLLHSSSIDFTQLEDNPLSLTLKRGFAYSDCATDDARLVLGVAQLAHEHDADILTRTQFETAKRIKDKNNTFWEITLRNVKTDETSTVRAQAIVNAAGPWVSSVIHEGFKKENKKHLSLVKGTHIVVAKTYEGDQAYLLQNQDQRLTFVIPYHKLYLLIGTTEIPFTGDPKDAKPTEEEIEYLCDNYNDYFHDSISPENVLSSFAGVRPLIHQDESTPSSISREFRFLLDDDDKACPLLSVFGGKLTTFRSLAEKAVNKLNAYFPQMGPDWTRNAVIPGSDFPENSIDKLLELLSKEFPWANQTLINRLVKQFGTCTLEVLAGATSLKDLGKHFGADLYQKEIDYMCRKEWAQTADDILWRRTKLGLVIPPSQQAQLEDWLLEQQQ